MTDAAHNIINHFFVLFCIICFHGCSTRGYPVPENETSHMNTDSDTTTSAGDGGDATIDSETTLDQRPGTQTETNTFVDSAIDDDQVIAVDTDANDDILFDIRYDISPQIATVGVVYWTIDAAIDSARIVFGPSNGRFEHEGSIPVDGTEHRALLLGMKPNTSYKFAIVADTASLDGQSAKSFTSAVRELTTGPQRTGLPTPQITDEGGEGNPFQGFTIGCVEGTTDVDDDTSTIYIYDKDGDFVWWYTFDVDDCSRARMSYDGKRMWGCNGNVTGNTGVLFSVAMDGEGEQIIDETDVPGMEKRHHDFAVLKNGNLLYFERDPLPPGKGATPFGYYINDEADTIYELDPVSLTKTLIYYQNDHFQTEIEEDGSHTNAINVVPHLNAIAFSIKNIHTIAVVSYPAGELLYAFGGEQSTYGTMSWETQHDFQVLEDGLVLFNNTGPKEGSAVLKYTIHGPSAILDWDYSPGIQSNTWGSASQLPNGNVLAVFSNNGVIHELNPNGKRIQSTEIQDIKYIKKRERLYGPPPP